MVRASQVALAVLRILVGWHFLYEGWVKVTDPGWSAGAYLKAATGPLAAFYFWMTAEPTRLQLIDWVNAWGLLAIGLLLILGLWTRVAAWAGALLLAMYYWAQPPLFGHLLASGAEGNTLLVNRNLVELCALAVVALSAPFLAVDNLMRKERDHMAPGYMQPLPRRQVVAGLVGLPVLGAFLLAVLKKHGWQSVESIQLRRHVTARRNPRDSFVGGATRAVRVTPVSELKGRLPQARIKGVQLSRVILGGNLIAGFAHARDLIYVDQLIRAYHSREKIYQTLGLAEQCGINTVLANPFVLTVMEGYWRSGGRIQFISNCGGDDVPAMIRESVDRGSSACYLHGGISDKAVAEGRTPWIGELIEKIRRQGVPAGIGAHSLKTVRACVEAGIRPDFWMKTLHRTDYWSASPKPENDNTWCESPEETIRYMNEMPEPWIAFKVLAAGALKPAVGFRHAFEGGADFLCVGMYDFQIVDDVNLILQVLQSPLARTRQWRA